MPADTLPEWLGEVHGLLGQLRSAGLRVSVGDEGRVLAVLAHLRRGGVVVDKPERLAQWISPVVCRSRREQAELAQRLELRARAWHAGGGDPAQRAGQDGAADGDSASRRVAGADTQARVPPPIAYARAHAQRQALVDARGRIQGRGGLWAALAVAMLLSLLVLWESNRDTPPQPTEAPPVPASSEAQLPSGPKQGTTPAPPVLGPVIARGRTLLASVPLCALALLVAANRRRRHALDRRLRAHRDDGRVVPFDAAPVRYFRDLGLSKSFQALRRHEPVQTSALDPRATVRATVRRGGFVRLCYAQRRSLASPVLLVDRQSADDPCAALADHLAERLREEQIAHARYDFHGDPQLLRVVGVRGAAARVVALEDLAAQHGEQPLWIFSDLAHFISEVDGEPRPWVGRLAAWSQATLLTPWPPRDWSERERRLGSLGFDVVPATPAGIVRLAQLRCDGTRAPRSQTPQAGGRLARLLWQRAERWLSVVAPAEHEIVALVDALREDLGELRFDVLCAVATFPAVHHEVTLWIASSMPGGGDALDEEGYGQLALLPWLRKGVFPPWLRRALIRRIPGPRRQELRRLFLRVLQPREEAGAGFSLPISAGDERTWIDALLAVLQREKDSPLRDEIFLGFLRGDDVAEGAVEAPRALAERLRRAFSASEWIGIVACAAASLAGWFGYAPIAAALDATWQGSGMQADWAAVSGIVGRGSRAIGAWSDRLGNRQLVASAALVVASLLGWFAAAVKPWRGPDARVSRPRSETLWVALVGIPICAILAAGLWGSGPVATGTSNADLGRGKAGLSPGAAPPSADRPDFVIFNGDRKDPANRRRWVRVDGSTWEEHYPNGYTTSLKFLREDVVNGVRGTVWQKQDERTQFDFLPNPGVGDQKLYWRQGNGAWVWIDRISADTKGVRQQ